jgi:hypothetical protein
MTPETQGDTILFESVQQLNHETSHLLDSKLGTNIFENGIMIFRFKSWFFIIKKSS